MAYSHPSHKRTVHCRYCYQSGHNRSSCPTLAGDIETLRIKHGDSHPKVELYDLKKAKRHKKGKERKCSFCGEKGHNRATCEDLKKQMAETLAENAVYRAAILQRMRLLGVGFGAIISSERNTNRIDQADCNSDHYRVPQVITQVNWDNINFWNTKYTYFDDDSPFFTRPLTDLHRMHPQMTGWPWDEGIIKLIMIENTASEWIGGTHWRYDDRDSFFTTVESPVPSIEPPTGWLLGGTRVIKKAYKQREIWEGSL